MVGGDMACGTLCRADYTEEVIQSLLGPVTKEPNHSMARKKAEEGEKKISPIRNTMMVMINAGDDGGE